MKRLTKGMSLILTTSIIATCIPAKNVFATTDIPESLREIYANAKDMPVAMPPIMPSTVTPPGTAMKVQKVTEAKDFMFNKESGTISGYIGTDKEVIIPETIDGVQVKAIAPNIGMVEVMFADGGGDSGPMIHNLWEGVEKLVLPKGMTSIESSAFYQCSSLSNIYMPITLVSIGASAFEGTSIKEVTIPTRVEKVASNAFPSDCNVHGEVFPSQIVTLKPNPIATTTEKQIPIAIPLPDPMNVTEPYSGIVCPKATTTCQVYPTSTPGYNGTGNTTTQVQWGTSVGTSTPGYNPTPPGYATPPGYPTTPGNKPTGIGTATILIAQEVGTGTPSTQDTTKPQAAPVAPPVSSSVENKSDYNAQKVATETISSDEDSPKVASTSSTSDNKAIIPMIGLMLLSVLGIKKQKKLN